MLIGSKHSDETKLKISKAHQGKKLSSTHRDKVVKTLRKGEGKNNANWKGGKSLKQDGYVLIRKPKHPSSYKNGYMFEHRYIMEKKLGRKLKKYEHVHHKNGVKDDNRPDNLELVNAQSHNLISRLEKRVKELEKENKQLRKQIKEV